MSDAQLVVHVLEAEDDLGREEPGGVRLEAAVDVVGEVPARQVLHGQVVEGQVSVVISAAIRIGKLRGKQGVADSAEN